MSLKTRFTVSTLRPTRTLFASMRGRRDFLPIGSPRYAGSSARRTGNKTLRFFQRIADCFLHGHGGAFGPRAFALRLRQGFPGLIHGLIELDFLALLQRSAD